MPNYNKSIIYKLCCKDINIKEIYIGSTTNFTRRTCEHKKSCNNEKHKAYNFNVYRFIRENGNWSNWDMVLLEEVSCENRKQLHKIEREYIEKLGATLNSRIPSRTEKEWREVNKELRKEWREDNKEKIKEYEKEYREKNKEHSKEYRENNREKLKEYGKEYYEKNKEKIKEDNKEYNKEYRKLRTICMCGIDINFARKRRHLKTKKHKNLMKIFIKNFKKE